MINTDTNIYDIMNNGKRYIGNGNALFPPHPEDLMGGAPCCN